MIQLTEENAARYLRSGGYIEDENVRVTPLSGGVSNIVLRVTTDRDDFVIKQALPKLNVAQEWRAKLERLHTEVACLHLLTEILPLGSVPSLRFFDASNYIYGMAAVSDTFAMWKERLMLGEVDFDVVRRAAGLLASIHASTWGREEVRERFDDMEAFFQLRVDPYYGAICAKHPALAAEIKAVMEAVPHETHALVHGDYSPKNLLVRGSEIVLLDFEVAHYGDPAFDAAFMVNHLLLKSVHLSRRREQLLDAAQRFWEHYVVSLGWETSKREMELRDRTLQELERRTLAHLGCLQLARVDGKSPAEYLTSEAERNRVRSLARLLLTERVGSVPAGIARYG